MKFLRILTALIVLVFMCAWLRLWIAGMSETRIFNLLASGSEVIAAIVLMRVLGRKAAK